MAAGEVSADFMPEPPGRLLEAHALVGKPLATALLRELAHQRIPIALRRRRDLRTHGFGRIVECRDDALTLDLDEIDPGLPMIAGDDYVAVAYLDGVKIQFDAHLDEDCAAGRRRLLRGPQPPAVYRLQRREAYRVAVATSEGRCVIRRAPGKELAVPLRDLSARGLLITWRDRALPAVGTVWEHARIEFVGRAPLPCTLVASRVDSTGDGSGLVGCEFGPMPPEVERAIQILVNDLQRTPRPAPPGTGPA
ncbi:MAG: PilZ domain-containing protein [Burkholderiaceae bacterium]